MNWRHLQTLLWLRWRMSINHFGRHGRLNLIILLVIGGLALLGSIAGFFGALLLGLSKLPTAPQEFFLYVCDVWVLAFLFFWMVGLINDLQRGEMLSLDKLLHLPTTLTEVYLFNFLSSLLTLTTLTFVPPMLGLIIAAVCTQGFAALVMFPLLAGFVLMVCAVTYQFRGWLATIMANKRHRQTVMVVIGMTFMVLSQIPNFFNIALQRQLRQQSNAEMTEFTRKHQEIQAKVATGKMSAVESQKQMQTLNEQRAANIDAALRKSRDRINQILGVVNLVLPIGWMPYGANAAAAGNPWPGLLATLGMAGIVAISLRRSYHTTLRYYTGEFSGSTPRPLVAATVSVPVKTPRLTGNMVEWSWPLVSKPVAAIAWTTLRSLLRAPEVKMLILGPLIMLILYCGMVLPSQGAQEITGMNRSFFPMAIVGLSIMGLGQLSHNCFGLDRAGFRAYVLSATARYQILLGKNLALVPLVLGLTLPLLIIVQVIAPAPWTHFLATLLEIPAVYLVMSLLGNLNSIVCPICLASGSLKAANSKGITILVQFVFGMATLTVLSLVTVLPIGLEFLFVFLGWLSSAVPVALILAILELTLSILLYRVVIRWQGELLQAREWQILEAVTEKGE